MTERVHAFYDKEDNEVFIGDTVAVVIDSLYEEGIVTLVDGEPAILNGAYLERDYSDYMILVKREE